MSPLVYAFDIDGTITAAPDAFRELMAALIEAGHEIIVLTGSMDPEITDHHIERRVAQLLALGIAKDTHYDRLMVYGEGPEVVAARKAECCKREGVALVFEDSLQYAAHIVRHCPVMVMYPRV